MSRMPSLLPCPSPLALVHVCCAPCACAMLEWLVRQGVRPVVHFYNPNIDTLAEHDRRAAESRRHAERLGLRWVPGAWDHAAWLAHVRGLESEPERGSRCQACFEFRLRASFRLAAEMGLLCVATSLASSRWKSLEQVDRAALTAQDETGVAYYAQNWRRGGLSERKAQITREMGFYCQRYCGCEFS